MSHIILNKVSRRWGKSLERHGLIGTLRRAFYKITYYYPREYLLPSRYRERKLERAFDITFGVDTVGMFEVSDLLLDNKNRRYSTAYHATPLKLFQEAFDGLSIDYNNFIFIDFGSGKGRALLLASELPFKKIIGIEFVPELHFAALENIRRYRSKTQKCHAIESVLMDASAFALPKEKLICYFYNPFTEEIMSGVLSNIRLSLVEHPRDIYIIYVTTVLDDLLARFGFEKIKTGRHHIVYSALTQNAI